MLILVESLSVLSIILDEFGRKQTHKPMVVFGSRFKDDVSYTQVNTHIIDSNTLTLMSQVEQNRQLEAIKWTMDKEI